MSTHSPFSPSQLPRIIRCPGSVKATANMKSKSSSYAEEGTMLHSVTEEALTLGLTSLTDAIIGTYSLTGEHISAVNDILDYVFTLKAKHEDEPYEFIETKVSLAKYAEDLGCPELEDVYGTLDYQLSFPQIKKLYVIDWKFGKGIEVFPDSEQLKAYALAALKRLELHKNFDDVHVIIGQPRLYAGELFKEQVYTTEELTSWAKNDLVPALLNARTKHPHFNPGKKACQWCEVKATCKERNRIAHETAAEVFKVHAQLPNQVNIEDILGLLGKAKELTSYIKDLELFVTNKLKNGETVPGYKLVAGRSLRKWDDVNSVIDYVATLGLTEFDISTMKIMSPAQLEKKLGRAQARTDEFQVLVVKPEGKPTLTNDGDKREALNFETAEDKFKQFV